MLGVRGFGPPISDMVGASAILRLLDSMGSFLARIWPSLFGYQFLVEARRLDDVESILDSTVSNPAVADEPGPAASSLDQNPIEAPVSVDLREAGP